MYLPPQNLPDHSRVWIYQAIRKLTPFEIKSIEADTRVFLDHWTAHNQALKASFEIRRQHFLILMIDEKVAGASGCSIDKSVHFIQELEKKYQVSLLNRLSLACFINNRVEVVSAARLKELFDQGILKEDSIVFNNLVQSKAELNSNWEIPLKNSWHKTLAGI